MLHDGHVHSPFCPHGSKDSLDSYVEKAAARGLKSITFTEHAPLPERFIDPVPEQDSSMDRQVLDEYLRAVETVKEKYKNIIEIRTGLEIDYIEGFEKETTDFLNEIGPFLDDAILSVHFLKTKKGYVCIDFDEHAFQRFAEDCGSLKAAYEAYYDAVEKSIKTDLGLYKPKRIGHMTLVHKFKKLFPAGFDDTPLIRSILDAALKYQVSLDINTAGIRKMHCGEPYPPLPVIKEAFSRGIPLMYGSDAHMSSDVGKDYETVAPFLK
ncbi:histidinol-phosphatase HisJ [Alkalicoccus halolimnae]|uniref:Histidinol-phosphatase n=1 Tax=Alkalicoccus halolimnae TaxID=1667239 RepID=A0A5C7F6S6_9BACI|nr:histidinol-phosphatase HisJ [Alkalicoccus halolimnae]TXF85713.1 histidinol-phosphatase HisJ [Alkalicoccus halolimnae]